jgi:hypothetical protein
VSPAIPVLETTPAIDMEVTWPSALRFAVKRVHLEQLVVDI